MGLWVFNDCCREEFHGIVFSIEKIHRDGRQQVKGGSNQPSAKQLQLRVGVKPTLADCLDGLMVLYDMHHSEYGAFSMSGKSMIFPYACVFLVFYNHQRR